MADRQTKPQTMTKPSVAPRPNLASGAGLVSESGMKKLMENFRDQPQFSLRSDFGAFGDRNLTAPSNLKSRFEQNDTFGGDFSQKVIKQSTFHTSQQTNVKSTTTVQSSVTTKVLRSQKSEASSDILHESFPRSSFLSTGAPFGAAQDGQGIPPHQDVKHSFGSLIRRFETKETESTNRTNDNTVKVATHTQVVKNISSGGGSSITQFSARDSKGFDGRLDEVIKPALMPRPQNLNRVGGVLVQDAIKQPTSNDSFSSTPKSSDIPLKDESGRSPKTTCTEKSRRVGVHSIQVHSVTSDGTGVQLGMTSSRSTKTTETSSTNSGTNDGNKTDIQTFHAQKTFAQSHSSSKPLKISSMEDEFDNDNFWGNKFLERPVIDTGDVKDNHMQVPSRGLEQVIPIIQLPVRTKASDSSDNDTITSPEMDYDDVYVAANNIRRTQQESANSNDDVDAEVMENNVVRSSKGEHVAFSKQEHHVIVKHKTTEKMDISSDEENYEFVDQFRGEKKADVHPSSSPLIGSDIEDNHDSSPGRSPHGRRKGADKSRYRSEPGLKTLSATDLDDYEQKSASDTEDVVYDDVNISDASSDDGYEPVAAVLEAISKEDLDEDAARHHSLPDKMKKIGQKASGHMQALRRKLVKRKKNAPGEELVKANSLDIVRTRDQKPRSNSQPLRATTSLCGQMSALSGTDQRIRSSSSSPKREPVLDVDQENDKRRIRNDIVVIRIPDEVNTPPERPPPRKAKVGGVDLNAVVPVAMHSLHPSFPDGYLGDPKLSRSCENLLPRKDINERPPAALPRETEALNLSVSPGLTRRRSGAVIRRSSRGNRPMPQEEFEGYLKMNQVDQSAQSGKVPDTNTDDDSDYLEAVEDMNFLHVSKQSYHSSWSSEKKTCGGVSTESHSYLELVEDVSITRLKRAQRYKSRFGAEAPLYQVYHRDCLVSSLRSGSSVDEDDECDPQLKAITGPSLPAITDAEDIKEENIYTDFSPSSESVDEAECESPVAKEQPPVDFTTPTLQQFSNKSSTGQRSLWCEMPEVKNSGSLQRMSPNERKLQETLFEIITSEASYQKSLLVLINNFLLSPLFSEEQSSKSLISRQDKHFIFSNVAAVMEASEKLLIDLEGRWQKSCILDTICDVIAEHASNSFEVYVKYCANQVYQTRTLNKLVVENREFKEALKSLETNPACQGLPMKSFLLLPMQRVTRLPLLIDAVCHRCDPDKDKNIYESAKRALEIIQGVVSRCNEGARNMERMEQMVEIEKTLKFKIKQIPLISASRYLIKKGELTRLIADTSAIKLLVKAKPTKQQVCLFLFNDILLLTKKKGPDQFVVFDYCSRIALHVDLIEDADKDPRVPENLPGNIKNIFVLVLLENHENKQAEFIFSAESLSDRARWIEVLSPAAQEGSDEKVYEAWDCPQVQAVFPYQAQQPDELSLDESDVINIVRKMGDGWYEGERIRDGQKGWFPCNHTMEILNAHVRARNLKQRYRLLVLSQAEVNKKAKN